MTNKKVTCGDCGTKHGINPNKHTFRPKFCMTCRAVIANPSPKLRIMSIFQKRKKTRKEATRKRFLDRLLATGESMAYAAKKLTKVFKGED